MVGREDDYLEAEIDELNDLLSDEGPPPEPQPQPDPDPEPEPAPEGSDFWGEGDGGDAWDDGGGGDYDGDDDDYDGERRPFRLRRPAMVATAVIIAAGVVIAAVFLFTQQLPPPGTTAQVMTRNCDPTTVTPSGGIVVGSSGHVVWSCTPAPVTPAFTVGSSGTVTPSFSLGTGFTHLYIYPVATGPIGADCASAVDEKELFDGANIFFGSGDIHGWNYCGDYTDAPATFGSMTVSWEQQ